MNKRTFELPMLTEYGRLAEIVNGSDPNPCQGSPQGSPGKPPVPPYDCYGLHSGS
jgi:hypothetical protein